LTCFPGLSGFCIKQLKDLNYEVIGKLNEILKVNETESNKDVPLSNTTKYVLEFSYNYILIQQLYITNNNNNNITNKHLANGGSTGVDLGDDPPMGRKLKKFFLPPIQFLHAQFK
jgi:hypothetical protein